MRQSTSTIDLALQKDEIKMTSRLTVYKSRLKFKPVNVNEAGVVPTLFSHSSAEPMPEAVNWNEDIEEYITAFPSVDGNLCLAKVKSGDIIEVRNSGSPINIGNDCQISMFGNYVFAYYDSEWIRILIDYSAFMAGNEECVSGVSSIAPINSAGANKPGAIHAITENDGVLFYIDEGGVGVLYWNILGNTYSKFNGRFFNPTQIYGEDDYWKTHFSTTVISEDTIWCYFTHYNGEVRGISYRNSTWSDIFVAVPSDLSSFNIVNSFVNSSGEIFLCGNFVRTGDFIGNSYLLMLKSIDGKVFTLDANKLVTISDRRYFVCFNEASIIFTSGRRWYEDLLPPYTVIGESTQSQELECISITSNGDGLTAVLKSGAEEYFGLEILEQGAYAKVDIGVSTIVGIEYIKLFDVVVESFSTSYADGSRKHTVQLLTDGKYHASMMTYPFYIEMQGRQSLYTNAKEFDVLYKMSGSTGVEWSMSVDFWNSEAVGAAFTPRGHAGGASTIHMSQDLKTQIFVEYPLFGALPTYRAKIYGWSRAGVQDTNPNTPDYTPVTTLNDKFYLVLEMQKEDGTKISWESADADLASTYANPPQTYFIEGARAGSYPIEYDVPNPGEGTKIIKIGAKVVSDTGNTLYYIERIEMPEIVAVYPADESVQNPSFQIQEATTTWPLVESIPLQITNANATNGNKVLTSVSMKDGYCYAIVVEGQVKYSRNGLRIIQDAEYYCYSDLSDSPFYDPTWGRNYPPGEGPIENPCVVVDSKDFPYFSLTLHTNKNSVKTKSTFVQNHRYSFKHADDRFRSSTIKKTKIPYVYSGTDAIGISVYLTGTGAITDIEDGAFVVHVFESPVPFRKFKYYGGVTVHGGGSFEILENDRNSFIPEHPYKTFTSVTTYDGGAGSFDWDDILIRPTPYTDMKVTMRYTLKLLPSLGWEQVNYMWNAINKIPDIPGAPETIVSDDAAPSQLEVEYEINDVFQFHYTDGYNVQITQGWFYPYPHAHIQIEREVLIEIATQIPVNPQVPVPPSFILVNPDGSLMSDDNINKQMLSMQKGVPQVLLSTTPYSAFNFEVVGRMSVQGGFSYAGVLGLATDEKNYVVGYFKIGAIGLALVRNGITTTLHEENISEIIEVDKIYDIRLTHRDGVFFVDIKKAEDPWGFRGTFNEQYADSHGFTYRWKEADGNLCDVDDIFHVGLWGYINPPKFRTTGYLSSQQFIPILPADVNPKYGNSDVMNRWVDGTQFQIDIQGVIYNYATVGKTLKNLLAPYMGPFQIRNIETWNEPFNSDRNGKTYIGGRAVEFTMFQWLDGVTFAEMYKDALVASSSGYSWELDESQWKVWITTGGEVVWLRNRSRHYSDDLPDYFADGLEKFYITDGLGGITPVSDIEFQHPHGTFVYLHSGDYILIEGFSAISGDPDQSIKSIIEVIMKTAGSNASFPGDKRIDSLDLSEDVPEEI